MNHSPNFFVINEFVLRYKKKFSFLAVAFLVVFAIIASFVYQTVGNAATYTWDGGGGDENWSTAANWSSDIVPGSSDIAVFNGTSTKNATMDVAVNVAGIDVNVGYTGIITQANTITVGETDWDHNAGTFVGATQAITISGELDLNGGSWTSTSGTFTLKEDLRNDGTVTFAHNNGTINFVPDGSAEYVGNNSMTFYDVIVNPIGGTDAIRTPNASSTYIIENSLTLTNGEIDSSTGTAWILQGTLSIASTFDGGTGNIDLQADVDIVGVHNYTYPGFTFTNALSSYTGPGGGDLVTFEGPLNVSAGTVALGDGTTTMGGWTDTGAGTGTIGNGTIIVASTGTWDVDSTATVNNFVVNGSFMTIASGDTIIASGTTTLTNGAINTGTLRATGAVANSPSTFDGGTGTFEVACACTFTAAGDMPGINLNHASADYTNIHSSDQQVEGDLTLTLGTYNAGANETKVFGAINNIGGTFVHDNGLFNIYVWSGNGPISETVDGDFAFYDLEVEGDYSVTVEFNATDTYSVANDLISTALSRTGSKNYFVSDTPGVAVSMAFATDTAFADAGMKDVNNAGAGTPICITRCIDNGNNTGFDIGRAAVSLGDVSSFTTTEAGGTSMVSVSLLHKPTANVVVTPTTGDATEVAVTPSTITLTSANYLTAQTFTFTGQDDADDDGPIEVTVTFTAASGDSDYSAIPIVSKTVTNIDDDVADDSIGFDIAANFSHEDVKDSGAANVTWFDWDYQGMGTLRESDGGSAVDISSSQIQSGCVIDIAGTNYKIVFSYVGSTGYIRISPVPAVDASYPFEDIAPEGVVNSIRCTGSFDDAQSGGLTEGWVLNRTVTGLSDGFDGNYYDSLNDVIWSVGAPGFSDVTRVDQTTLAQTITGSTAVGSNGSDMGGTYDPTRGYLWLPNYSTDTIVVFDGSTGGYAFGTIGASTFSVTDRPQMATYDATQDAIWIIGGGSTGDVTKLDASNGALISTTDLAPLGLSSNFGNHGIAHDVGTNSVMFTINNAADVVKLDATNGAAFDTNLTTSTYTTGLNHTVDWLGAKAKLNQTLGEYYVPYTGCDYQKSGDTVGDHVTIIDVTDGSIAGHIEVSTCIYQMYMDEVNDILYINNEIPGMITAVDLATRTQTLYYTAVPDSSNLAVDAEGDVWFDQQWDSDLVEFVVDGVPQDKYYTVMSNDNAQLDTSADGGLSAVAVDETLDSGFIYYSLSFDDRSSFVVFDGSARVIASDQNSDHGGTNGNWYYRDNASTWAASSSNSAQEALSLAVAAGANNQMTGTELGALGSAVLESADGFTAGTLDAATTFYTTDAHNAPVVNDLTFTLSAGAVEGGGGTLSILTTNESIAGESCVASRDTTFTLDGNNIQDYLLTEDAGLAGASWTAFNAEAPFTLSEGDGVKTVYAKFRSSTGNQSGLFSVELTLDETTACEDVVVEPVNGTEEETVDNSGTPDATNPDIGTGSGDGSSGGTSGGGTSGGSFGSLTDLNFVDCLGDARTILAEERNTYMFGVARVGKSTPNGFPSQISQVDPGDYLRSESFDTVYCVTEDLERRPFVGEKDYFTHTRSFLQTRWVTDETMAALSLVGPMLPKIGTSLLKFESTHNVYLHDVNEEDNTKGLLYWITTEELAKVMIGTAWADFVIDVSPALFPRFDFGDPLITSREVDTTDLRERELLNEEAANAEALEEDVTTAGFLERFRSIIPGK